MEEENVIIEFFPTESVKYMDIFPYKSQIKELLSLNLDRCMEALCARRGSIFLVDDKNNELILEVAKSSNDISLQDIRIHLGERVAGRVALERRPFLVEDIDREPRLCSLSHYSNYKSKSFLSLPVEFSGDLIGVLSIAEKITGAAFNDDDLRIALDICKHLGVTLYSLQKYLVEQKKTCTQHKQELKELKRSVDHSQKYASLGKIVGGLVHEINNPLDGVMRYVNLSLDSLSSEDTVKE